MCGYFGETTIIQSSLCKSDRLLCMCIAQVNWETGKEAAPGLSIHDALFSCSYSSQNRHSSPAQAIQTTGEQIQVNKGRKILNIAHMSSGRVYGITRGGRSEGIEPSFYEIKQTK